MVVLHDVPRHRDHPAGRDPRDAWAFAQRICGVCTTVHAIASIRAVENAIGATPPPNARLLRNLIMAAQNVQDHVVHFYHLHALDWVDIVYALERRSGQDLLARAVDLRLAAVEHEVLRRVRDRVKAFVERGQLGPFANAYWGHPAYKLPPEANLMAVAHYLEALDWQRRFIRIHAILGGKNPHLQSFLVGGMATPVDPDSQAALNMDTIAALQKLVADGARLRQPRLPPGRAGDRVFLQGLGVYRRGRRELPGLWRLSGWTTANIPELFLPTGIIHDRDLTKIEHGRSGEDHRVDHALLVRLYGGDDKALNPFKGETNPQLHRTEAAVSGLDVAAEIQLAEIAALRRRADGGRAAGAHAGRLRSGRPPRVKELVDTALSTLGVGPEALFSTLGRIAARAIEAQVLVESMDTLGAGPRRQHGAARLSHPGQFEMGSVFLAGGLLGRRLARGAARVARALGPHQ